MNTTKQEIERVKQVEMAKKIEEFKELMKDISSHWENLEDTTFIDEEYPFEASFDEMAMRVMEWSHSVNEKLGL